MPTTTSPATRPALAAIAALAVLTALALAGCQAPKATAPAADADRALESFFSAKALQGRYTVRRVSPSDGDDYSSESSFTVRGSSFRTDMLSGPDGAADSIIGTGPVAYFVRDKERVCEPSVAGSDFYLAIFRRSDAPMKKLAADPKSGAERFLFVVKKRWDMKGSANAWYLEDIEYHVRDGRIVRVIVRSEKPEKDGTIPPLSVATYDFTELELVSDVPDATFVLPYPVSAHK